jgi:hypothetical protein
MVRKTRTITDRNAILATKSTFCGSENLLSELIVDVFEMCANSFACATVACMRIREHYARPSVESQ